MARITYIYVWQRFDPGHDKNLPITSVTGSINQNVFKFFFLFSFSVSTEEEEVITADQEVNVELQPGNEGLFL